MPRPRGAGRSPTARLHGAADLRAVDRPGAAQRKGKNVRAPIVAQAAIAPQPNEKYSLPWKDYRRRWAE